jgi:3-oxoacyl-[acyl-carrier protein] reductase
MTKPTRFWETSPDTWRMIIDTNVNGPFYMAKAAVPQMMAAGWGRIVNVSMSYETMKRPGFTPYGPSKAALESETIIWAQDLKDTGITVNALLPGGPVETGMIPPSFPDDMRRRLLRPDIVVPPLLWLASERSNGFTGRRLTGIEWTPEMGDQLGTAVAEAGWR